MFIKILLIGIVAATLGGTSAGFPTPQAVELSAGTLRVKSGDGAIFKARIDQPAPLSVAIKLSENNRLIIQF